MKVLFVLAASALTFAMFSYAFVVILSSIGLPGWFVGAVSGLIGFLGAVLSAQLLLLSLEW